MWRSFFVLWRIFFQVWKLLYVGKIELKHNPYTFLFAWSVLLILPVCCYLFFVRGVEIWKSIIAEYFLGEMLRILFKQLETLGRNPGDSEGIFAAGGCGFHHGRLRRTGGIAARLECVQVTPRRCCADVTSPPPGMGGRPPYDDTAQSGNLWRGTEFIPVYWTVFAQ